jgi:hypothetical protein
MKGTYFVLLNNGTMNSKHRLGDTLTSGFGCTTAGRVPRNIFRLDKFSKLATLRARF